MIETLTVFSFFLAVVAFLLSLLALLAVGVIRKQLTQMALAVQHLAEAMKKSTAWYSEVNQELSKKGKVLSEHSETLSKLEDLVRQ